MTQSNTAGTLAAVPAHTQSSPSSTARGRALGALRASLQRADPGVLAQLRRGDPSSPPPAFFRIAVGTLDEVLTARGAEYARDESRWAVVAKSMAMALGTAGSTGGLLGTVPFGEALARAGVAERRVLQLLEAHDDRLATLVRHVVSQLVSKGQPFAPNDLADLVIDDGTERGETARRRIARHFYRHHDGT